MENSERNKSITKKCLAGLNDITAAGMNGFSTLAAESIKRMDLAKDLETGKCYLEAKILNKCNASSTLPTHSTSFALSDESDLALQQPHYSSLSEECGDCYLLLSSLSEIDKQAAEHGNPDLVYDVQVAIADVVAYMKHQIRDAQQKQVKAVAINLLNEESAFWLKDYCQKVLPSKFREGQKEYFGKKWMTLHVDVIFFLDSIGDLQKNVYFTTVYQCDQGIIDFLSIANLLLDKLHKDLPRVKDLYAKSDNARSYHGNSYAEALYVVCKDKGFTVKQYDYNEPCRGKDQCDCETAGAKSY